MTRRILLSVFVAILCVLNTAYSTTATTSVVPFPQYADAIVGHFNFDCASDTLEVCLSSNGTVRPYRIRWGFVSATSTTCWVTSSSVPIISDSLKVTTTTIELPSWPNGSFSYSVMNLNPQNDSLQDILIYGADLSDTTNADSTRFAVCLYGQNMLNTESNVLFEAISGEYVSTPLVKRNLSYSGTYQLLDSYDAFGGVVYQLSQQTMNTLNPGESSAMVLDVKDNSGQNRYDLKIYPNPIAQNAIATIEGLTGVELCYINIYDLAGNLVLSVEAQPGVNGTTHVNIPQLAHGLYMVHVTAPAQNMFFSHKLQVMSK